VTQLAQLRLQVRALAARVGALEAARPAPRKRTAAPRPGDAIIGERERLWVRYVMLEMQHGHGRVALTRLSFSVRWRLNPTEFNRWFSARDRRGIPAGSAPDQRFHRALADAIAELEARQKSKSQAVTLNSRGNMLPSHFPDARPQ
jgi:hypothetical protein